MRGGIRHAVRHRRQRGHGRRCGRKIAQSRIRRPAATEVTGVQELVEAELAPLKPPVQDQDEPPEERWLMVYLVAAAYVIWQMDKVNMSVAVLPMSSEYGWNPSEVGLIQSALFWGYASTQVIGGFLATRFGGKRVLLGAVVLWSGMTAIAPLAASVSTQVFIASRVLVGIGEGLAPAAGIRVVATWMPKAERSRSVATLGGGKNAGAIIGLLVAPFVINAAGWPAMFYSFGALGLGWAAVWLVLGKDREPAALEAGASGASTTSAVAVDKTVDKEDAPIPWLEILSTPALWAVVVAHFCQDWGAYALLTWTPSYLNKELGYDLQGSSELTVVPSALAVATALLAGNVADSLSKGGMELTTVRKIMQSTGFIIPAVCLSLLGTLNGADLQPGSLLPVALLTAGIAGSAFALAGLYASHADLNAKYSGLFNGISTTFGALAGVASNAYAGYVLGSTGSWNQAIFLPSVICYVIGIAVYCAVYDATPRDWDEEAAEKARSG